MAATNHVKFLRDYMPDLSEEVRQVSFTVMKYFWDQYSVPTWNAAAFIAHEAVSITLELFGPESMSPAVCEG
ncbi:hypothetical protein PV08_11826 [Exophiala spinifera]|uniref:Uncharacterized protein n=1 Tax=Exophiala spinifera TaxID=91928 RepID=A0A0D2AUB5_9EURO|nr:uncharacterized protein PV08_11826 [Exophiala spinifera]KIW10050.1 hypothetical protein PV08_11826 [Exophiala spinifera]